MIKKALKSIVSWLDRKFPDKIVLNVDEYTKLIKRIDSLESEVSKFNVSLGFGVSGTGKIGVSGFQR